MVFPRRLAKARWIGNHLCANAAVLTWFLIITNYPNSQSRASLIARVPPLRCYVTKMMEFDRCVPILYEEANPFLLFNYGLKGLHLFIRIIIRFRVQLAIDCVSLKIFPSFFKNWFTIANSLVISILWDRRVAIPAFSDSWYTLRFTVYNDRSIASLSFLIISGNLRWITQLFCLFFVVVYLASISYDLSGWCSVQESDGSFFESYTALCWKQENRRLQVMREDDQPLVAQPSEGDGRIDSSQFISSKEVRHLN